MRGKVCVVTGATSGIGYVTAERLARQGATLALVGRNLERGHETLRRLRGAVSSLNAVLFYADLSRISEMKRVAGDIASAHPRIDVLVNCAGALFAKRQTTGDGLERTFALNHLSYFVLANLLFPNLKRGPASRIVNVASGAHRGRRLHPDDLQSARRYGAYAVYGRSKLANILFTREMARRTKDSGVAVNCLHPGFVATRFASNNTGPFAALIGLLMAGARTPEKGAETVVYLATAPDIANVTGEYFQDCRIARPTAGARDDAMAKLLWDESVRLTGVDLPS